MAPEGALCLLLAGLAGALLIGTRHVSAEPRLTSSPAAVHLPEEAPADCALDPPTPVVAIRVRVPAYSAPGQEVRYRICVENCSTAAAHHVVVRNPLPANARYVRAEPEPSVREPELVWRLDTLAAGVCKEISLVLAPTGEGDVLNCARVQFEHGQCVRTRLSRADLSLQKIGPTRAILFDALTYQLVVTNTGSAEVSNVVLTDTLPAGLEHASGQSSLSWNVGTLAPGQSRRVDYQVIAKRADRLCNQAVVTAAGGLRQEASFCVTVVEPRLLIVKTGPEKRFLNRPATYLISVSNPGTAPATNVVITDVLPPGTTLVSASPGSRVSGNQVQWPIGTLPPGTRLTVQLSLKAQAVGEVRNRASVTAARGLSATAEFVTLFEGATGLTVDVDDRDDPVEVGKDTSYVITVVNQGPVPATKVQVAAVVPELMAITDAKGPSNAARDAGKVVFEPVTIPAGGTAVFEVFVKPLKPGDARFRVELSADQLPAGPVRREESTTIYQDTPARPAPAPERTPPRNGP